MKKTIAFSLLIMIFLSLTASAQTEIVPILETKIYGLLGGVKDGKFIDAKTTFAELKGKRSYAVYDTRQKIATITAEIEAPLQDDPCDDFYRAKIELDDIDGVAVGANAGWNLMPRAPKTVDLKNPVYIKAASDALRAKGIINKAPKLSDVIRIDLEGDGQEEVLLSATSYGSGIQPSAKKGDYSFVLLRKIVGGKPRNIIVTGDFVTKKISFGTPSKFGISSIVDLNGDGKMEIVVYGVYYEGSWIETYEMKGDKPAAIEALNIGCGV